MELLLAASTDFIIVAFTLVMVIDFMTGLHQLWTDSLTLNGKSHPGPQESSTHQPEAVETPVVEDPWSVEVELTTPTYCCHPAILRIAPENLSLTAITSPPQLLLAPALEVANQPELDLAAMPSSQLRKLCSERGIKWRGVHGGKHLSKPEMLAALGG